MVTRIQDLLPLVAQLQAEPERDGSLRALGERAGLSPAHLQRVFARTVGESPKRLATRVAVERAAARLVSTADSVLTVALDAGFETHEGFIRAFRRRFGMSPTEYRRRGLAGGGGRDAAVAHREVVARAAPCVNLYAIRAGGRPADPSRRESMSYEIAKKTIEERPFLFARRRIQPDEIATAIGELLPAVFSYGVRQGIAFAGPPVCRYRDVTAGGMTLEAGMPLSEPAEGEGDVLAGSLPGGKVASTIHTGPYDGLPGAHAAIERWIEANGLRSAGDPWEVYVTDPGEVPNPEEWKTEVLRPIEG